jgi:hypothetical protein
MSRFGRLVWWLPASAKAGWFVLLTAKILSFRNGWIWDGWKEND